MKEVEEARKRAAQQRKERESERAKEALNATTESAGGAADSAAYSLSLPAPAARVQHPLVQAMLDGNDDGIDVMLFDAAPGMSDAPADNAGRAVSHYAAFFSDEKVAKYLLKEHDAAISNAIAEEVRGVRQREVHRKSSGEATEAGATDYFTLEVERLERLGQLRREECYIALLSQRDKRERTPLHYGAASRSLGVEVFLEGGGGADFEAVGSSTQRPLFLEHAWMCTRCGMLVGDASDASPSSGGGAGPPPADAGGVTPWDSRAPPTEMPSADTAAHGPGREFRASHDGGVGRGGRFAAHAAVSRSADGAVGRSEPPRCYNRDCDGAPSTSLAELRAQRRAVVNARDVLGGTPLHYAAVSGDVRATKCLLRNGADRTLRDANGNQPLGLAAHRVVRAALMPLTTAVSHACHSDAGSRSVAGDDGSAPADEALRMLVAAGADVNHRNGVLLRSSLHFAAQQGELEVVKYLLSVGAEIDQVDANGWTALHIASEGGTMAHHSVAKHLLAGGADANKRTNANKTPLHLAAMQNWVGRPSGPLSPRKGKRASGAAETAGAESVEAAARSSAAGAEDDGGRGGGGDEEMKAGEEGGDPHAHPVGDSMLRLLVGAGTDIEAVDNSKNTAAHWAARKGRVRALQCLLSLGANGYAQNEFGSSVLHLAVEFGHANVASLVCRHDAELGKLKRLRDCHNKRAADLANGTAIRMAQETLWEAAAAGDLDLVASLVRAGNANTSWSKPWGPAAVWESTRVLARNAVHAVVEGCAARVRRMLYEDRARQLGKRIKGGLGVPLAAGIGLQLRKPRGLPPPEPREGSKLHDRIVETQKEFGLVLSLLVRAGVDVDGADNDGTTPLMLAARHGLVTLAQILLRNGASTDASDFEGNTALHYASAFHKTSAAQAIESAGGDEEAVNASGKSPLDVAGAGESLHASPAILLLVPNENDD